MTTKFNQEMYTKMKAKKNKPISSLGKKVVRVIEKEISVTLTVSVPKATRTTSPTTSLEELTTRLKRQRTMAKGKEKMGSRASNVWDDARIALARAHSIVITDDLKALFGVPSHKLVQVNCHIHKLVQVNFLLFCLWFGMVLIIL